MVERNTVYDSEIGIDIGSGRRNVIRGNTVHHCSDGIALSSNNGSAGAGLLPLLVLATVLALLRRRRPGRA